MTKYYTKVLDTGKCTGYALEFLKSLGWIVESGWCIRGDNAVEVYSPDRWSVYITDIRFEYRHVL